MRIVLLLLFFIQGTLLGQTPNSSPIFIQLAQVEQAPIFTGCNSLDFPDCSVEKITSFFIENLDEVLLSSLAPEEAVLILRFIVDSEGKARSPKVQTKSEELKVAGEVILAGLPHFIPGKHQGEKVNVILDIPLKIEIPGPVPNTLITYDSPAMAMNCKKMTEPKLCTSEFVQQFFFNNLQNRKFKTGGKWLKAVIKFTIDREGKVTDITAEGENEEFNTEGIRVIKGLPEFIPALRDGESIPMDFSVPIMIHSK